MKLITNSVSINLLMVLKITTLIFMGMQRFKHDVDHERIGLLGNRAFPGGPPFVFRQWGPFYG